MKNLESFEKSGHFDFFLIFAICTILAVVILLIKKTLVGEKASLRSLKFIIMTIFLVENKYL